MPVIDNRGDNLENFDIKARPKLTFDEMIIHMKNKNIKFNMISEDEAKKILQESNYFFKVLSYRKNFEKDKEDRYLDLEFGMLTDLATIDMRLRYIVLKMCLDIEHNIKTKMLKDITNDDTEDGYSIVQDFFYDSNIDVETLLKPLKRESNYNFGLFDTYGENLPVWVLFEIISFGAFVKFVEFYYRRTNKDQYYKTLYKLLRYVKNIRNSAAHNSPLIMDAVVSGQLKAQPEHFVSNYVGQIQRITKEVRRKRLTNRKTHDLTVLLTVHDRYIDSKPMKEARYKALKEFLEIVTRYDNWFKRMIEYGFSENEDYKSVREKVQSEKRERTYSMINHHIKIDMAKEISMLQRNEKGKQARQYFIEIEKKWNH